MSKPIPDSTMEDRLAHVEHELAAHRRRLVARARFTGFAAALVLVLLSFYFYYGYRELNVLFEPKTLVSLAENTIVDSLVPARQMLEEEIKNGAPGWADMLSREVQDSLPQAREELEKYIVEQLGEMLDASSALSEEQFRGFLKENHEVLERGFQDLASSPEMAEQTMQEVIAGLDRQLSTQMSDEALQLFATLLLMKEKLAKLRSGHELSPEQRLERQALMLTRRLQMETVDQPGAVPVAGAATSIDASSADTSSATPAGTPDEGKEVPAETVDEPKDDAAGDEAANEEPKEDAPPDAETE